MKEEKLKSRIIIVTGGSSGIGLAVAKKIASKGGTLIICSRNKENLIDAVDDLEKLSGNKHYFYSLNVSNIEEIKNFYEWVKNNFGKINGLVNCAGIFGPIGKTPKVDLNEFEEAIKINLMGTIFMADVFFDLFSSDYKKKIINFSGGGATSPFPNYSAYAISKIGVVKFTENLSIELKEDNFDVNCIAPGFVATKIHQKTIESGPEIAGQEHYENTLKQIKEGGVSPEKAADLVSFLLSDDSNGITGKLISAQWDNWKDIEFQNLLKTDKDFASLRRIDNKSFFKK